MSRVKEWGFKSHGMELDEEFYSFDYADDLSGYQDPNELLAAFKQKEEEVILAAELGNALLLENRQLKEENDKLHEQYGDKLEELEQNRHELRVKLDSCKMAWENQVAELERDVQELTIQTERLNQALSKAECNKTQTQREHADENNRLKEQLNKALEVERVLTAGLQAFKQGFGEQGRSGSRDEELISAMKEQVACLSQKNLSLEQRLEVLCQENAGLQESFADLHKRLVLQEEQGLQQTQQLADAEREVEVSRGRNQQLQEQVEQLQEEISMQEPGRGEASLLSELEQSFSNMDWSQDKEQVKEEVLSILKILLPLTDQAKTMGDSLCQESLDSMLLLLRNVAHRLTCSHAPQELNAPIVGSLRENSDLIRELRDQNSKLMAENSELKIRVENSQERELTQQAIRDRDEAIVKKNAMEAELLRCKNDMMSLNNQLLEAIQRKLELSQELEAWQDDIQVILNQQLQSQQQSERGLKKTNTNRLAFLLRSSTPKLERRCPPSPTSSASSSSSSHISERTQALWKDWLKRGKIGQHRN